MITDEILQLNEFWWRRLPVYARKVSRTLAAFLLDSIYLSRWERSGAIAPIVIFLSGFLIGCYHYDFKYESTYTYSILVLSFFTIVSSLGAGVGLFLWLGYILGDFFFYDHHEAMELWDTIKRVRLPLILSYALLFQLLVLIPLAGTALRHETLRQGSSEGLQVGIMAVILQALTQGFLLWVWVHAVPVLIRPLFTWWGSEPEVAAIKPLQEQGEVLVILALIVACIRVTLEQEANQNSDYWHRLQQLQSKLNRLPGRSFSLPYWFVYLWQAAGITFLLSGLITHWLETALLAGSLFALLQLSGKPMPWLQSWYKRIRQVPIWLRLALAVMLNIGLAFLIIDPLYERFASKREFAFVPVILSVIGSVTMFLLLFPAQKLLSPKTPTYEEV